MRFIVNFLQATQNEYTIPLQSDGIVYFVASHGIEVCEYLNGLVRIRISENFTYGGIVAFNNSVQTRITIHRNLPESIVLATVGDCLVLDTDYLKDFRLFHHSHTGKKRVEIQPMLNVRGWKGELFFISSNHKFTYNLSPIEEESLPQVEYFPTLKYRNNRVELELRVENSTQDIEVRGDFVKDIKVIDGSVVGNAVNSTVFGFEKWFEFTINSQSFRIYVCKKDKLPTHLLPTSQPERYRFNQPTPITLTVIIDSKTITIPANSLYVDTYGASSISIHTQDMQCLFTQVFESNKILPALHLLSDPLRGQIDTTAKTPVKFKLVGHSEIYRIQPGEYSVELGVILKPGVRILQVEWVENADVFEKMFYILS